MRKPKHERRRRKRVSRAFRDVGKRLQEERHAEHLKAGRRYGKTITLPLSKHPHRNRTHYRVPGMKPLLHNGGKPR